MAGDRGDLFPISRSVRQGCPLAPTLFLFFAEAMSSFLGDQGTGLQGLRLPIREDDLLDAEFADDTAVFLAGQEENLSRFQDALELFCDASGAKINWHKSCGFWTGAGDPPAWLPDPLFRWIPPGTSVRYLGCHVGLELAAEQQIAPLLLSIRRKLVFWSTARLSLAGRVVVANQVLLATMWYITSCWNLDLLQFLHQSGLEADSELPMVWRGWIGRQGQGGLVSDHPPDGPGWARGDRSGLPESSPLREARGSRSPSGLGALEGTSPSPA